MRSWATSFVRRPDFGPDWEMQGTGLPPRTEVTATPETLLLVPGQPARDRNLAEASVGLFQILVPPGAVVKVSGVGFGKLRVSDPRSPEVSLAGDFELTYCARACICPDGTDLATSMPTTPNLLATAALSNAPFQGWLTAEVIAPPCPPETLPQDPPTCQSPATGDSGPARLLAAARQQPCETPHPCNWGLGVREVTQWIPRRHP